jgi:isopenicillin-N N-acyltransferase-like protein
VYDAYLAGAHPAFHAGARGIAEGAELDPLDVMALNVRYEILYSAIAAQRLADGCTAFAAYGAGHLLLGQNWDWIPEVRGAIVSFKTAAGQALAFTEAGIFGGKIGLNAAGVGLAINGMTSVDDDWHPTGHPFHARCWDVLSSATLSEAIEAVTSGQRSCSAHFLLGQPGEGAASIEAAPHGAWVDRRGPGTLVVHANHFLHAERIGTRESPYDRRPISLHRQARLDARLAGADTVEAVQAALRDHDGYPDSVCRHPSPTEPETRPYQTMTSIVMDLDARDLWAAAGTPCTSTYHRFHLENVA